MSITPSHHRSGGYVKGHFRGDTWVSGHYRSGTYVTQYERPEADPRRWSLADPGRQLTHPTECRWCGAAVFFYRDRNGGCALFESLGRPWPIHGCWQDRARQPAIRERIGEELAEREYDGVFMPPAGALVQKPVDDLRVVRVAGYVADNEALYGESKLFRLSAHRRASTCELAIVNVWSDRDLYPFVVPRPKAEAIRDYEPVELTGTWLARGRSWHLIATGIWIDPQIGISERIHLPRARDVCAICGGALDGMWGCTDDGRVECRPCGDMRGVLPRRVFIRRVKAIVQQSSWGSSR